MCLVFDVIWFAVGMFGLLDFVCFICLVYWFVLILGLFCGYRCKFVYCLPCGVCLLLCVVLLVFVICLTLYWVLALIDCFV